MTISAQSKIWTDEEFMALPDNGDRYEIVDGELKIVGNSGMLHGHIASVLIVFLGGLVRSQKLGVICDSSTAFKMKSGNKRSPDISFVAKDRLKGLKKLPRGFFEGAPDLAVEVISPSNTFEEIHQKIVEYFESGSRLVWVINPDEESVIVYRSATPDRLLKKADFLDGEEVVDGFRLAIAELFTDLDFD
ncbi:Uma2 family endonuclease [Leptolyngbya sp. FACHB-17]|uniref:Uma2 family endonuclease n=1 Tax=unclassified Leptolyngbya TaxID=2650499 RepID=UPI00168078B8|nr:Uma2 family endonuclease [Leptolyngbya sp. FACHB-17]MBD2079862.1 Uma2 family endonuclease [Leptolyngbya sp. FACHB-17]